MTNADYHRDIIDYYNSTENAYRDSWDLDNSLAIHYGYWDRQVKNFPQSLMRMNEVMKEAAAIMPGDYILDAGCGVGGSSIFLAAAGNHVTGITLSERQVMQAKNNADKRNVALLTDFLVADYCSTGFADNTFDIVWGCESICYADDKCKFIKEAYRVLKPGGRLIVADGFVTKKEYNDHPIIRQWLDGWMVNYLETTEEFQACMDRSGFKNIRGRDISMYTRRSSRRLYYFYFLSQAYLRWKQLTSSRKFTDIQKKNSLACKFQFQGMKKDLWRYGLVTGVK